MLMIEINLKESIDMLLEHLKEKNVFTSGNVMEYIENIEKSLKIKLPKDFKEYYQSCNGMENLYPNHTDETGFLFYPIEKLVSYDIEFGTGTKLNELMQSKQCLIFINYLQKSWWYGILTELDGNTEDYSIVIIPTQERYKVITNSLKKFIELYLIDSPILYDHE